MKKSKKEKDKDKKDQSIEVNKYKRLYNELVVPLLFQSPQKNYSCEVKIISRD